MPLRRQYSLADVKSVLNASEGRPSPVSGASAHAIQHHGGAAKAHLVGRNLAGTNSAGSYATFDDLAAGTLDVLNSTAGQAALGELDSGGKARVVISGPVTSGGVQAYAEIGETWSPPGMDSDSNSFIRDSQRNLAMHGNLGGTGMRSVSQGVVIVDKVDGDTILIQTSYPSALV